jgi:hypothetical protein
MPIETRKGTNYSLPSPGPFLAKIVNHLDPSYMGTVEVQLLHEAGNDSESEMQLHQVKYLSPFTGQTSLVHADSGEDVYNSTQKSYGFWMIPPDVGVIVMVIFVDGDPRKGYCIGCVSDLNMNFMIPGNAATKFVTDKISDAERVPVAEYNKLIHTTSLDPTKINKPATPQERLLDTQGLLKDDIRGITTSSARREVPSAVFGISTPGPVDKKNGAKKGAIGVGGSKISQAFVSRLGGSSFVMDDGDDKFIRQTTANQGPPEYAAVERGESGLKDIPHNELIRIRTRTGHQILMHNSEDLIYIGNARGTTWIELTSNGKIDIFAEDSVSLHTKADLNFYADRDINFEAGRNFNLKVKERHYTETGTDKIVIINGKLAVQVAESSDTTVDGPTKITAKEGFDLKTTGINKFSASESTNIKSGKQHIETAEAIHMNGPQAANADAAIPPTPLATFKNLDETGNASIESIMLRVPTHEPWPCHENLSPLNVTAEKTDRETNKFAPPKPAAWKNYSTSTDTFSKEFSGD